MAAVVDIKKQKEKTAAPPFLPPAFELIPRLLLLLDDPEANSEALARVIRVDPGLTAEVLKLANAVQFAGVHRTETLQDAIMRVGLREVYRTVLKVVAAPILENTQASVARLDLWTHSLCVAVAAQTMAQHTGDDPEVAFTAGLLHDLGKAIFAQTAGSEYVSLIEQSRNGSDWLWMAEQKSLGIHHAEAGSRLLADWNIAERVVSAVAWHHEPTGCPRQHRRMTALTHLGNAMAYRLGHGYGFPTYAADPEAACFHVLGMRPQDLDGLEERIALGLSREMECFR
jgi:putative nucleotidyltransferase with HDIG domain